MNNKFIYPSIDVKLNNEFEAEIKTYLRVLLNEKYYLFTIQLTTSWTDLPGLSITRLIEELSRLNEEVNKSLEFIKKGNLQTIGKLDEDQESKVISEHLKNLNKYINLY